MAGGLSYDSGREMPQGMQIAAAKQFLGNEAAAMLAVLKLVDVDCEFCINAWNEMPCADTIPEVWCPECKEQKCHCCGCTDNSKYQWCGAEEALRRLEIIVKK